jgi:hypothetical protein
MLASDVLIEQVEDLGDRVVALLTLRAIRKESGVEVAQRWAHVVIESNGDQQIRSYSTWEQALEAVGLRPED